MLFYKFSVLFSLAFFSCSLFAMNTPFSSDECLKANFSAEVKNQKQFFGLLKKEFIIKKKECHLNITYKNILPTNWEIDVCREPVHMKVTSKGSLNVYKRKGDCIKNKKSDYCYFYKKLSEKIQDEGLIFADGEKELLTTSHGQIYCSHLLLEKYLKEGIIFSRYKESPNLFESSKKRQGNFAPRVIEHREESPKALKKEESKSGATLAPLKDKTDEEVF